MDNKIQELFDLFDIAEQEIKEVECFPGCNFFPTAAVNQLRYSGRHFLNAITFSDKEKAKEQLELACRHAKRSRYDAVESALQMLLLMVDGFQTDFKDIEITSSFPEWNTLHSKCCQADRFIKETERLTRENDTLKPPRF